ncbi:limbic system-associated membrane protein-like [Mercenaria mercenaria]|uniref:limbic system-associated membrane protein-like n=1 Tax=Mercenaria mercenaria TaxID=6596 RepID=UPI00234F1966|nr:limbic system-associated membrane protein-like [Mercenaria mercenaria]
MDMYMKILIVFCLLTTSVADWDYWDHDPRPIVHCPNTHVTATEGETAILPCYVQRLGKYKVAWLQQGSRLITVGRKRITDDPRFELKQPHKTEWNLHIQNVTYSDQGQYILRVNTNPFTSQTMNLTVTVPAKIRTDSSNVTILREGDTLVLTCNATGIPKPFVMWSKFNSYFNTSGEVLIVENVTRSYSGTYGCAAENGVTARKQFKVTVEFAPEVTLLAKQMHQVIGREIFLECKSVANPRADMYWLKDKGTLEHLDKKKYQVDTLTGNPDGTTTTLSLRLPNLQEDQLGEYTCVAKNSICKTSDTVVVHEFSGIGTSTMETKHIETNLSDTVNTSIPVNESTEAPAVTVLAKGIGQSRGRETILDCKIVANPRADMYWLKDNATLEFFDKKKYQVEEYAAWADRNYTTLSLRLPNLQKDQLGEYTCVANNTLGKDFDTVVLYDYSGKVPGHGTCSSSKGTKDEVSSGKTFRSDALFVMAFYWMIRFSSIDKFTLRHVFGDTGL